MEKLAKPWGEIELYWKYGQKITEGFLPYKDFFPEYPPLSLTFFWISSLFGEYWFTLIYYGLVVFFTALTAFLIYKMGGNHFIFLSSSLILGGLFWDRFDIFPAFFSLLAFYLSSSWSFLALSLGGLIKIYPVLFLPFFIKKLSLKTLFIFLLFPALSVLIIIGYGGLEGLNRLATFQGKRGVHLESIRATPLLVQNLLGVKKSTVYFSHNTFEIK